MLRRPQRSSLFPYTTLFLSAEIMESPQDTPQEDPQDNQDAQNQEGAAITTEFDMDAVFDHPHFNLAAGAGTLAIAVALYMVTRPSAETSKANAGKKDDQDDSTHG
eukprot:303558_1